MSGSPRRSLADATYAITADTGEIGRQALLLCRSIRHNCPRAQIVTFVPEGSLSSLAPAVRSVLESHSTVVTGEIPIPEYPLSALGEAFVRAADRAEYEHVVMLDTDTVMLSPPTVPDDDADLYLKPVDGGLGYWGTDRSYADWRRLYDHFDVPFPTDRIESTVDESPILPYWNGGVVVTTDRSFPAEWLAATREVLEADVTTYDGTFYAEQLSLAIRAETRNVTPLGERQNYPLQSYLTCPRDVEVVHYRFRSNLARIPDPWLREELRFLGAEMSIDAVELFRRLIKVGHARSGAVLSPRQYARVKEALVAGGRRVFG